MKKGLLYILINFSSVVIADWITVEHDFNMCDQAVPSDVAAFHIDDDGIAYSTSLLVRDFKTISHNSPLTTVNITMWGCTYDCHFSFMVNINRDELTVSSYTENNQNNYKCNLSNKTMKLIPTPKITYRQKNPNPAHAFPTDLTAQYCSEGKHPDVPDFPIKKTENVAECIDYLTGSEVGTYAASLLFGSGSSFLPDDYPVATYHMINSANKVFNYWERHHRGFHDALNELSEKMTPDNLKQLVPPPPPPPKHKHNILKSIFIGIAMVVAVAALYLGVTYFTLIPDAMASATVAAEFGAAEDVIATTAEGSVARATAEGWANEAIESSTNLGRFRNVMVDGVGCSRNIELCENVAMRDTASYYQTSTNPNIQQYLTSLGSSSKSPMQKRDKGDNIGFFTINKINNNFLPTLMDNVHQSFTGSGQIYTDISSYLSAASEHLQFHFEDTLHNNFFTANKSILASFTINQGVKNYDLLDGDDDVYKHIRDNTYNHMAASIISKSLRNFNVEICDTKPSFCGQPCDSGHIYCPTIGDDKCIIAASDGQIKELQFLRDTFDICSTNTTATGWNITHNSNCNSNQFQCQ